MQKENAKINASSVRGKLIKSAKKLFAKKGYSAVSIREIATNARVNSAGISYHFSSKLGIYKSILEDSLHTTLDKLKPLNNTNLSSNQKLIEFQKIMISIIQDDPQINFLIHRTMISTLNKKVKQLLDDIYIKPLTEQFKNIISSCEFDRKVDFINEERIIFSIIAIPAYWSLFQNGYKDMFANSKSNIDIVTEASNFAVDLLTLLLKSRNK